MSDILALNQAKINLLSEVDAKIRARLFLWITGVRESPRPRFDVDHELTFFTKAFMEYSDLLADCRKMDRALSQVLVNHMQVIMLALGEFVDNYSKAEEAALINTYHEINTWLNFLRLSLMNHFCLGPV